MYILRIEYYNSNEIPMVPMPLSYKIFFTYRNHVPTYKTKFVRKRFTEVKRFVNFFRPDTTGYLADFSAVGRISGLIHLIAVRRTLTLLPVGGFQTHISKSSERGVKLNFLCFFHRGIRNKKVCKVKNFQVWGPHDIFE